MGLSGRQRSGRVSDENLGRGNSKAGHHEVIGDLRNIGERLVGLNKDRERFIDTIFVEQQTRARPHARNLMLRPELVCVTDLNRLGDQLPSTVEILTTA